MTRLIRWNGLCWLGLLVFLLAGCELNRPANGNDIEAGFVPPVAVKPLQNTGTTIRLEPLTPQVSLGQPIALQIFIDNAVNVTEINLQLRFPPTLLQVLDADPANEGVQLQPGNLFDPEIVDLKEADNTTGLIDYSVVPAPFSGSGLLATINFQTLAGGAGEVAFNIAEVFTEDGEVIVPAPTPSQISVMAQPGQPTIAPLQPTATPQPGVTLILETPTPLITDTPTATNTPAPTNTPTPTLTPTPTNTPVPPQVVIPPGATVGFCYRVQLGETLYSLGQKFNIDPHFISRANDLHPPDYVFPQQILFMPEQYGQGPNVYLVKPGDTIPAIAEACRLDVDFVASVNGVSRDANLEGIGYLLIPRPPYPPPSRYPYPGSPVWPPVCPDPCTW